MLTPEMAKVILKFLDRTPITGHQERDAMNTVTEALENISVPKRPGPLSSVDTEITSN